MAKKNLTLEEKLEEAIVKDGPYEVPGNWVWTTFEKIVNINPKKVDVKELDDSIECSFIPMNIVDNEFGLIHETEIKRLGEVRKGYTNFIEGDIIFAKITPCMENRKSAIVPKLKNDLGYGSTEFHVFRTDSKYVDNRYIFYFIRSHEFISDATSSMTGAVGQQRVPKGFIESYKVPFPPLKEQRRIADRIESLFEKLDKAKELIEEARNGFEKRKSVVLEKAFRGELTEKWRHDTKINGVKDTKFEELFAFIGGGTPSKANKEYWNGEINWASVKDIKNSYLYDTIDKITEKGVKNSSTNVAKNGEIILVTRISPGKVTIAQKDIAINQDLKIVRPKIEEIEYKYMYYLFLYKEKELISKSQGTTVKGITISELNKIQISLPVLEEQKEIVRILDKLLEEETKIENLSQLEEQIELIKKSILAKAFRGELGTNCGEDESALELLKEILSKQ